MRVSPIALSLVTGYASVKPTASHRHVSDRILASADDTTDCRGLEGLDMALLCDNDVETCPNNNQYTFKTFTVNQPQTVILYPNKNYDWSTVNKEEITIEYFNSVGAYLDLQYISFGADTNNDTPEGPIVLAAKVVQNVRFIKFPINIFCEVEAFMEADAPPSFVDTVTLKDEHDIANVGDATFSFSESSKNKEMIMEYSVYAAYTNSVYLSFFDHECTTAIASGFGYSMTVGAGDPATITAEIDLDLATLVANGVLWTGSSYSGQLKYCVRADVVSAVDIDANDSTNYIGTTGDSLSFVENKYTLTITMEQDFDDFTVVAAKEDAGNENEDAETSYSVDACQCNDSQECEPSTLNQNSLLDICIKLNENAAGVVLGAVKSLTLTQGSVTVAAITDKVSNSLTNVSGMDSKTGLVKTRLISAFFTDSSGSELTVSGAVVIKFSNARGRQLMNAASEQVRRVQNNEDVAGEGSFDFNVELNAVEEAPSVGSSSGFASIATIMAMATGFVGLL